MVTAGWPEWASWTDTDAVLTRLASGAAPNARLHSIGNTPLHEALWEPRPEPDVVQALLAYGADAEAVNDAGETPLWCAVRRGSERAALALLEVGADPWRPVVAGRSAGRVALDGPLARIFIDLPGAPAIDDEERGRQAEADALIKEYARLPRVAPQIATGICVAFVSGVDEDEVIRRIGARPAHCPLGSLDDCMDAFYQVNQRPGAEVLWVGTPPDGGVVVLHQMGVLPVEDRFGARISAGGGVLAGMFDDSSGGEQRVRWWRDGRLSACPSPYLDPRAEDPPEAWLCRFGDHADPSGYVERNLALMAMLTGVRPGAQWLEHAPKRIVGLPYWR